MASSGFTSETVHQLMQLVDKHNDEMNEHTYVQMCNLLKNVNENKNQANTHNEEPPSFVLYRYYLHNIIFLICKHYDENIKVEDINRKQVVARRKVYLTDSYYSHARRGMFDIELRKNDEKERFFFNQYLGHLIHDICRVYFESLSIIDICDKQGDLRKKLSDMREFYETFHPQTFEPYRRALNYR